MALTRIKTNNILDRQVFENDLADSAVTFEKIQITGSAAAGDVLKVNGSGELLFEPASGTSTTLNALTDVNTAGVLSGDSLVYDLGSDTWKPGSNVPSSLGLNSLTDVTLGPTSQNDFLRFDGFKWVSDKVSVIYIESIADVAITGLLNDLVDVEVTGATVNQRLGFDGSEWRAVDAGDFGSIDQLTDVDTTGKIDGDALVYDGGTLTWGAVTISGLGASSRTTVVQNVTAMLAQGLKIADQTYVIDGATVGEWELYLLHTLPGSVIGEWSKISTQDSGESDANTAVATVFFNTGTPVTIGNISDGSRVVSVTIEILPGDEFDGNIINLPNPTVPAFFSIGDDGDNARLIDDSAVDWSTAGTYVCNTDYVYDGTEVGGSADTDLKAYFDFTNSTTGEARLLVTYV